MIVETGDLIIIEEISDTREVIWLNEKIKSNPYCIFDEVYGYNYEAMSKWTTEYMGAI